MVDGMYRLAKWKCGRVAVVTNWSKFPVQLKLCDDVMGTFGTEVLHMPVYETLGLPASLFSTAIIFRARANKTAVMYLGNQHCTEKINASALVQKPYISASTHAV